MVRLLLEAGADPTLPGWMQLSALHRASAWRDSTRHPELRRIFEMLDSAARHPGRSRQRVDAALTESGHWLVASGNGAWLDGKQVLTDGQMLDAGDFAVSMTESGRWLVASGNGAWLDGQQICSDGQMLDAGQVGAALTESGRWLVASGNGAWLGG